MNKNITPPKNNNNNNNNCSQSICAEIKTSGEHNKEKLLEN
jgi:hypothetical protein